MPGSCTICTAFIPNAGIFVASSRGVTLSGNTLSSPTSFCPNLAQLGPYNASGHDLGQRRNWLDYPADQLC